MKPKQHQIKYATGYKNKELVVHETGTGKTICACLWLKDGRDENALVICPKRIIKKWQETLTQWDTKATVLSKEQFKKQEKDQDIYGEDWSAIIIDEADEFASPLFVKGRSQLTESLYEFIKVYDDIPILCLTATPIRSNPWNLHTLLCFTGHYIDWKEWRQKFFTLQYRPYLSRPAYFPVSDWRKHMRPILEKYSDIVLLRDCVDDLPSMTENLIEVPSSAFKDNPEWSPMASFVAEHRHEQENKAKTILEIGKGYRKVLVVAHYLEQIEELEKELSKNRQTFVVHGSVKNQEEILKEANEIDECFLIVQASLGAGFDADSFSCVVFASMSYKSRDWVQMKGRVRRIHNLHPVVYNYLIGGECDKAVYKTIMAGRDFLPSEWDYRNSQNSKEEEKQTSPLPF